MCACAQRFFGTAVGKGRQAAKTEIERLKLGELSCEQGVTEVAKMCGAASGLTVARDAPTKRPPLHVARGACVVAVCASELAVTLLLVVPGVTIMTLSDSVQVGVS